MAVALGFVAGLEFQHKCTKGFLWFENNVPWALPIVFAAIVLLPRRDWSGIVAVAILFALLYFAAAPVYLSIVHHH